MEPKAIRKAEPKVCLLVSHNSRIQCLLDNLQPSVGKIRFQNCAIMELILGKNYIRLDLVYSGEITENEKRNLKRKYYSTEVDPSPDYLAQKYRKYNTFEKRGEECNSFIKKLKLNPADLEEDFVFYIIRHGQSEHNVSSNVASIFHTTLDTSLVSSGLVAAENAGNFITKLGILKIFRIYISDLERTHQTVLKIMEKLGNVGVIPIVLPCANEVVASGQNGDCDSASAALYTVEKFGRENYPACTTTKIKDSKSHCSKLDWRLYLEFYGSKMRGENDTLYGMTFANKIVKEQCRNTTVIAMAIYEMYHLQQNKQKLSAFIQERNSSGGTRKKKRTIKNKNR
jgi:broad specificity phosphatase PhoE